MQGVKPRRLLVAAVLAAVGIWAAAAATVDAGNAAAKPRLLLASEAPLTVKGRGFKAGERVRVVASTARGRYRKVVSVSRRGLFNVRFGSVDASCGPLFVAAVGTEGTRATWRRPGIPPPCGADQDP
jgi:hypothetical protein